MLTRTDAELATKAFDQIAIIDAMLARLDAVKQTDPSSVSAQCLIKNVAAISSSHDGIVFNLGVLNAPEMTKWVEITLAFERDRLMERRAGWVDVLTKRGFADPKTAAPAAPAAERGA